MAFLLLLILHIITSVVSTECGHSVNSPIRLNWNLANYCLECLDNQDNVFILKGKNTECIPRIKFANNTDTSLFCLHYIIRFDFCSSWVILSPYSMKDIGHDTQAILPLKVFEGWRADSCLNVSEFIANWTAMSILIEDEDMEEVTTTISSTMTTDSAAYFGLELTTAPSEMATATSKFINEATPEVTEREEEAKMEETESIGEANTTKGTSDTIGEHRRKLADDLLVNYQYWIPPENFTTQFGIELLRIDVEPGRDLLITHAWMRMVWTDFRLRWDETHYGGIKVLQVSPKFVWIPDITLYNSNHPALECEQSNVLIYPNGEVLWVPPCRFETFCDFTFNINGPDSEQFFMMKFGSWTLDGNAMGLEFYGNASFSMGHYATKKYMVTTNTGRRDVKTYDCCEEPWLSLEFRMGFKSRKSEEVCQKGR